MSAMSWTGTKASQQQQLEQQPSDGGLMWPNLVKTTTWTRNTQIFISSTWLLSVSLVYSLKPPIGARIRNQSKMCTKEED